MTGLNDDSTWIVDRWDHLREYRLLGTRRPWRQPQQTREQRDAADQLARAEKADHPAFTLPGSPAPVHLDTVDLIHHVLKKVRHLAVAVATDLEHHKVLAVLQRHRANSPGDELDYIRRHYGRANEHVQAHATATIGRLRARMAEHFSELLDGQMLLADCPWCHQPGLVVRLIGPEHSLTPVVVCEHDGCEPGESECGQWWKGRPCWPVHEWEWLAGRIESNTQTG
jgi:hypothetical protein